MDHLKKDVMDWLVYKAGIAKASENHFGGDPNANAPIGANIQQRPGELASCILWLLNRKMIAGDKIEYYAEIGACAGGTSLAMTTFLNLKELLIIDDGGAENSNFYVNERKDQLRGSVLGFIPRVEIIGNSREKRVINLAKIISNEHQYDILFIDGDHSYSGVKQDTLNYLPIVRKGGYIIFHDIMHIPDIQRWLSELPNNLTCCVTFAESDPFTSCYPTGIGLRIYQKLD